MFIGAFLAAPIRHARHPTRSLWFSPGCPLHQQHSWSCISLQGHGHGILPHTMALL